MYMAEEHSEKWKPVMEHKDLPEIKDSYRRDVTLRLLENQEAFLKEAAPANHAGDMPDTGGVAKWDPILISLVRRAMPQMIAYDICGVQPMSGPTGLIFAMRPEYDTQGGTEAMYNEPDSSHSSLAGAAGSAGTAAVAGAQGGSPALALTNSIGVSTAVGEDWGTGSNVSGSAGVDFQQMAFSIERVAVTAKTRGLKGTYSMELAQDLKAVHGLDAETELANIISQEILAEINREVMRSIYFIATHGAQHNTTTAGVFDLDTDSNGRWSVEKFKGLLFQIEREANAIAKATRRGRGNIIITSSDVASALAMAGAMDGSGVDDTGNTFVGTLNGRYKVYVDPYFSASATNFFVCGYKGSSAYDAGLFYCPYVPIQMVRAVGEQSFQPSIGFKTRYGMVTNPFSDSTKDGAMNGSANYYYRTVRVDNLM